MIALSRTLVVCLAVALGVIAGSQLASDHRSIPPASTTTEPPTPANAVAETAASLSTLQAPIRSVPFPREREQAPKPPGRLTFGMRDGSRARLVDAVAVATKQREDVVEALLTPEREPEMRSALDAESQAVGRARDGYRHALETACEARFAPGSGGYEEIAMADAAGRDLANRVLAQYQSTTDHVSTRCTADDHGVPVRRIVRTPAGQVPELDSARSSFERSQTDAREHLVAILRR